MNSQLLSLTPMDFAIFALYLTAVLAIGLRAMRKAGAGKRDYFLAGDKLSWWMIGGSIVAANISTHQLVGVMGLAYASGFVAMTSEWGAILVGFNALLWVFLPFYLRNGFYTMPEFLERRFGPLARTAFAALILITYVFVEISAVLYLGATVLQVTLGIPLLVSIVLLALLAGTYTITGGLRAVVWTDMLQLSVLLLGGIALSLMTIWSAGGVSAVLATSDQWDLLLPANDPQFPWTMYLGGVLCISVFYCAANQFIVQRTLAARDEWHARMGVVFTDYLKFLLPLVVVVPGLVAPRLLPSHLESADMVFPMLVKTVLPAGLIGLVLAGLVAATMSHISGAVNSCTTIATVDFYLPFVNKNASEKQAVRFGKWTGIVIIALGIFWAHVLSGYRDRPVFLYLLEAYGYITPGVATMFLLGIFWKRATHAGALAAGLATIPLSFAMSQIGQHAEELHLPGWWIEYLTPFMNRTGVVFWTCMLLGIVVSLVTTPKPAAELEGLIWNVESLKLPDALRQRSRGLRSPLLWWLLITVIVVFFFVRYH